VEVVLFLSAEKLEAIAALCRAYGVKRLDLFGSAATDAFRPGASDVDLLVDFGDMGGRAKAHAYFDLQDGLREVLGTDVDLVMVAAVKNRYLARAIELTKQPLYAA
jgi:uncharacterized protein